MIIGRIATINEGYDFVTHVVSLCPAQVYSPLDFDPEFPDLPLELIYPAPELLDVGIRASLCRLGDDTMGVQYSLIVIFQGELVTGYTLSWRFGEITRRLSEYYMESTYPYLFPRP
jgi:hypothetical protein